MKKLFINGSEFKVTIVNAGFIHLEGKRGSESVLVHNIPGNRWIFLRYGTREEQVRSIEVATAGGRVTVVHVAHSEAAANAYMLQNEHTGVIDTLEDVVLIADCRDLGR